MITFHAPGERGIDCTDLKSCHPLVRKAVWIDLYEPTEQEELIIEAAFCVDVPTRREMGEIEVSSRLYKVGDDLFMTAIILTKADTKEPGSTAVTFILTANCLITVRYADPLPFVTFRAQVDRGQFESGQRIFEGLLDTIVDRLADILENIGANLDAVSRDIFRAREDIKKGSGAKQAAHSDLGEVLRNLGRSSDLGSRARESLVSLSRLLSFFVQSQKAPDPELAGHFHLLTRDLESLSDHTTFLSTKLNFLLDATLGLINIEQNAIIKIFTIAAVFFLPPTVVGTIYGMNFDRMPELKWAFGYPFAIVLMILSALAPYLYFKRKGWF